MKRLQGLPVLLALALSGGVLVGCGGGAENSDSQTMESPAAESPSQTEETAASPEASPEAVSSEPTEFTLVNDTDRPMLEFYVSEPTVDVWGENLIPKDAYIGPRKEIPVNISNPRSDCLYDLKAVFGPAEDGSVGGGELVQTKVEICDGATYTYSQN